MTTPQQMVMSNFNLETLGTKQLQTHIKCSIEAESNIAIFGRRGLGKTAISRAMIKSLGLKEVYMNLSVYERVDMGGYPDMFSPKEKGEKMERFINYILPRIFEPMLIGDEKVVALLDEVDKADSSLWAPLLEFLQEKSMNGRLLKNLLTVIMTGNLISEGGSRPSLPLLDRTEKYIVQSSVANWTEWAALSGKIHPSIYQFIVDNPDSLAGPVDAGENYADESPRGWENSSKVVSIGELRGWDVSIITDKVSGFVGRKSGIDYKMYFSNYKVLLPLVNRVFEGYDVKNEWSGLTPTEKLYTTVIICGRLATQLDAVPKTDLIDPLKKSQPPETLHYVGKFMQYAGDENVLIAVRQQLQLPRIVRWGLDTIPSWEGLLPKISSGVSS